MQKASNTTASTPQQIRKTIGKTTYEVSLHFSKTSTESAHDKLKRIIINDCTNCKAGFRKAKPHLCQELCQQRRKRRID